MLASSFAQYLISSRSGLTDGSCGGLGSNGNSASTGGEVTIPKEQKVLDEVRCLAVLLLLRAFTNGGTLEDIDALHLVVDIQDHVKVTEQIRWPGVGTQSWNQKMISLSVTGAGKYINIYINKNIETNLPTEK